jgi:hypothetical protein
MEGGETMKRIMYWIFGRVFGMDDLLEEGDGDDD